MSHNTTEKTVVYEGKRHESRVARMKATTERITRQCERGDTGSAERLRQHLANVAAYEAKRAQYLRLNVEGRQRALSMVARWVGR
jgi:hypothetical protein